MTTATQPVVFISHGAPTLALEDGAAHRFLRGYGDAIGKPRAVLVLSAHHCTTGAQVTSGASPGTIHDFYGFPQALYDLEYPAPGDPGVADEVVALLEAAGLDVQRDSERGFDHGAWIPLQLMYPGADVPLVQLSIDPRRGPDYHLHLGKLLAPLREHGVLIVGSGGITHNLGRLARGNDAAPTPDWAASFNEWVFAAIADWRIDDLVAYRQRGPQAALNHPSEEHFVPLFAVLGAAQPDEARERVHHSFTMGALSMDTYQFGSV